MSQASVLGPLFFVSINTLTELTVARNATLGIFADDIALYKEIGDYRDQTALARCNDGCILGEDVWSTSHRDNTKCMLITWKISYPC